MRIVFDTNVLIAALITAEGVCGNLVKRSAQVHTLFHTLKHQEPFNEERYIKNLKKLPTLPWE